MTAERPKREDAAGQAFESVLAGLNPIELDAVQVLALAVKSGRQIRSQRVAQCLEAMRAAGEVSQTVVLTAAKHYIENEKDDPSAYFNKILRGRAEVSLRAPGVFWIGIERINGEWSDELRKKLLQISFNGLRNFRDAAESLNLKRDAGNIALEFLYHWVAAQHPDSEAAQDIEYYGLASGRLAKNLAQGRYFDTSGLIFHESVLGEYVERECERDSQARSVINPVISLLATDDWEFATSQLTPRTRNKME